VVTLRVDPLRLCPPPSLYHLLRPRPSLPLTHRHLPTPQPLTSRCTPLPWAVASVDLSKLSALEEAFLRSEVSRLQREEETRASLRTTLQDQVTRRREAERNQRAADTEFARSMALKDTLQRVEEVKEEVEKQRVSLAPR
jgi:hypothetical protein